MLCANNLIATITAIAITIAEDKDADELDLLSAVFTQLGDTLATISVQKGIEKEKC